MHAKESMQNSQDFDRIMWTPQVGQCTDIFGPGGRRPSSPYLALSIHFNMSARPSLEMLTVQSFLRRTGTESAFVILAAAIPQADPLLVAAKRWPRLQVQPFSLRTFAERWGLPGSRSCSGLPSCLTGRQMGRLTRRYIPEPAGQIPATDFRFLLWLT